MKYHKLRIAWSTSWGVVGVLLIVLWARSYKSYEALVLDCPAFYVAFSSGIGKASFEIAHSAEQTEFRCDYTTQPVREGGLYRDKRIFELLYLLREHPRTTMLGLTHSIIPYCLLLPLASLFSTIPWLSQSRFLCRFSLRTLLIATTFIALALGLIVWLSR